MSSDYKFESRQFESAFAVSDERLHQVESIISKNFSERSRKYEINIIAEHSNESNRQEAPYKTIESLINAENSRSSPITKLILNIDSINDSTQIDTEDLIKCSIEFGQESPKLSSKPFKSMIYLRVDGNRIWRRDLFLELTPEIEKCLVRDKLYDVGARIRRWKYPLISIVLSIFVVVFAILGVNL